MEVEDGRSLPDWLDVSRETHARLCDLLAMVAKWNPAINLISQGSLSTAWQRHVLDSAQLFHLTAANGGLWADFGSGAGFPGLVLAIIAAEKAPDTRFALVESDRRKAVFLKQASRDLGVATQVICNRMEQVDPLLADVVTARALAPLPDLCGYANRHLTPAGVAIFPKGGRSDRELALAQKAWEFDCQTIQSLTDPAGAIFVLRNIRHA